VNAIQCDRCKCVGDAYSSVGWLQVERIGIDIGDPRGPFHFDSLKCMTEWALLTAGVREA
jgi:hypothetical protein